MQPSRKNRASKRDGTDEKQLQEQQATILPRPTPRTFKSISIEGCSGQLRLSLVMVVSIGLIM